MNYKIKKYINNLEKVDFQPFLTSQIELTDLCFFQNRSYIQNKLNIINYGFMSFLLYKNLLSNNKIIKDNTYLIDNFDLYNKYFIKAYLKYNGYTKFNTYFYNWIRKIKLEYYNKYKKYITNEIFYNFDLI